MHDLTFFFFFSAANQNSFNIKIIRFLPISPGVTFCAESVEVALNNSNEICVTRFAVEVLIIQFD